MYVHIYARLVTVGFQMQPQAEAEASLSLALGATVREPAHSAVQAASASEPGGLPALRLE